MSIKNPYEDFTFHGDQYGGYETKGNKEHNAFSEGVKAANEDWIREIDKHLKTYQGYEYLDSDWWEARKKVLEQ